MLSTCVSRARIDDWPRLKALLESVSLPRAGARDDLRTFVVADHPRTGSRNFGFRRISRDEVPEALAASEELLYGCASSAVVMRLDLS